MMIDQPYRIVQSDSLISEKIKIVYSRKIALVVLTLLTVVALALNAWYWTQLPERVASHFDIAGKPDGWMNKGNATLLMCSVQIGLPWLIVGIAAASCLPNSVINIPNRQYWLQPERRDISLAYLNGIVAWMGVLTSVFMISIGYLCYVANLAGAGLNVAWFALTLVVYLATVFALVGKLAWHFRMPHDPVSTSSELGPR